LEANNNIIDMAVEIATSPWADSFESDPYHDPAGYLTVGFGHLMSRERNKDKSGYAPITLVDAVAMLKQDMEKSLASVYRLIEFPLEDNQYAALVDFTFNCGSGNLQASTLRRVINRGELNEAPRQFRRWVHAGGVRLPGLVRRRQAEVDMWLS
jgi:lysozyme